MCSSDFAEETLGRNPALLSLTKKKKVRLVLKIRGVGTAGIFPLKEGYWSDTIMIIASGNFLLIGRTAGLVHGRRQHCRYRPKAPTPLSFAGRKEEKR